MCPLPVAQSTDQADNRTGQRGREKGIRKSGRASPPGQQQHAAAPERTRSLPGSKEAGDDETHKKTNPSPTPLARAEHS